MTSAVSAGIHGIGIDPARVRAFVNLVNPRGLLVLANPGIALEHVAGRLVIYRHWPNEFQNGDDGLFEKLPAVDYLKRAASLLAGDRRIVLHLDNEPFFGWGADRSSRVKAWADWALPGMRWAREVGWRCCVGNFATGNLVKADWTGELRPVLEELAQGWHVYGQHDYRVGSYEGSPDLIAHHRLAFQAADELGLPRPLVAITEIGIAAQEWRGQGFSEEGYADWLAGLDANYYRPDGVLFEAVFSFGGNWTNFDMSDKPAFWERVAAHASANPAPPFAWPSPAPEPDPQPTEPSEGWSECYARLLIRVRRLERANERLSELLGEAILELQRPA